MTKKQRVINKNKDLPSYKESPKRNVKTIPFNIFAADPLKEKQDASGWAFLVEFPQYFAKGKDRKEATKNLIKIVTAKVCNKDFMGTDAKIAKGMRFLLGCLREVGAFEIVGFNLSVNVIESNSLEN